MKFSVLVAIVPEESEQAAIDAARDLGAGGITLMSARGISNNAKKTFFGLSYDGSQSVLLMVLEKGLSLQILKAIQTILMPEQSDSKGLVPGGKISAAFTRNFLIIKDCVRCD